MSANANLAECPQCGERLRSIDLERVGLTVNGEPKGFAGVYRCPLCRAILSVGPYPADYATEIADEIARRMD